MNCLYLYCLVYFLIFFKKVFCTTYCGYVDFLIVIIFILLLFLFMFLIILLLIVLGNSRVYLIRIKTFNVGFFGDFELLFNVWNLLFIFIVLLIRIRVIFFSISYMRRNKVSNFVLLYVGFIFSMLWLIINNNFYWIIFGWDGLGVVSFLLIIFYMNSERVNNGLFTLFQNRIGDLFFVFFIIGTIDLVIWNNSVIKFGLLFLIFGACVKRAQFPFNSWLLSAIRAPTPISSLVHSSTLVVAGVFILLQYSYCLVDVLIILKYLRIISLFLSSFGLLNENDIKKLIAYSTINHVSLMIYLLRFKLFKVVYFHLNIHAIFKSLIFICFGFVILVSFHGQDKRLISLLNLNPLIKIIYYFSCLCLGGLPFLRAFFSKDLIIEKFIEFSLEIRYIFFLILFLGLRIYYSVKLFKLREVIFPFQLFEKSFLGLVRIFIISLIIIVVINLYLSLVFTLSLEFLSFKLRIYLLVLMFLFLSLFTNLNFKLINYDKIKSFVEVWFVDFYALDKFIYWNFVVCTESIKKLSQIKLLLLSNWWVLIVFTFVF